MRPFCAFMLVLALCAAPAGADDLSKFKPWTGGATPKLVLKDLDGKRHDLAQYRGKLVLMNFWATWCAPCLKEMPALQRLGEKLAKERFVLLTVNFGEGEDRVKPFAEKIGIRAPVLLDPDMNVTKVWVERGLPTTYVIDAGQKIRYLILGEVNWDNPAVEAKIRQLLP
ncbi:MAG: TlpA family protein disulfide reductase [Burkholderiales bacterium]